MKMKMIHLNGKRSKILITLCITLVFTTSCGKDTKIKNEPVVEAPYIAAEPVVDPWVPVDAISDQTVADTAVDDTQVINVVVQDTGPLPMGSWYSVKNGVFVRAQVWDDELFMSIQNQATFFNSDSMLIMSKEGKDVYAFFLPAALIPPYDYQTDYVAVPYGGIEEVDEFRVILQNNTQWNELLALAEDTELNMFYTHVGGVRGVFQGVAQTRHRSSFSELDWTVMAPVIQWTPRKDEASDGTMLLPNESGGVTGVQQVQAGDTSQQQQQGGYYTEPTQNPAEQPINQPNVVDNNGQGVNNQGQSSGGTQLNQSDYDADSPIPTSTPTPANIIVPTQAPPAPPTNKPATSSEMYDLSLEPTITHAGLKFSKIKINKSIMKMMGSVENVSNQGTAQTITFELLDANWKVITTISFGPGIPSVGQTTDLKLDIPPSAIGARFVRAVG